MSLRCEYINSEEGNYQYFNDTVDEMYFETTTYREASLNEDYLTVNVTSYGLREWFDDLDYLRNESWVVKTNESISAITGLLYEYDSHFTQINHDINSIGGEYVVSSFEENLIFKFLGKVTPESTAVSAFVSLFTGAALIIISRKKDRKKQLK